MYFLYHTVSQALAGAALGCIWGFWWHWVSFVAMTPLFEALEERSFVGKGMGVMGFKSLRSAGEPGLLHTDLTKD